MTAPLSLYVAIVVVAIMVIAVFVVLLMVIDKESKKVKKELFNLKAEKAEWKSLHGLYDKINLLETHFKIENGKRREESARYNDQIIALNAAEAMYAKKMKSLEGAVRLLLKRRSESLITISPVKKKRGRKKKVGVGPPNKRPSNWW